MIKSLAIAYRNSLKNLHIDWCSKISNSLLSYILNECRNIEALNIGCCEEVTDAAFQDVVNTKRNLGLKVIKVSNYPNIIVTRIGMLLQRTLKKDKEH